MNRLSAVCVFILVHLNHSINIKTLSDEAIKNHQANHESRDTIARQISSGDWQGGPDQYGC